jgi:hypothetical protein
MQQAVVRLDTDGIETTTVEIGCGATTNRISPRNAKKIQEFVDKNRIELAIVGSRVDPSKQVTAGKSDWDYLINECEGIAPRKKLRDVQNGVGKYLPRGRSRTDEFGNTRSGLDVERNVPLTPGKPYVKFRPRS